MSDLICQFPISMNRPAMVPLVGCNVSVFGASPRYPHIPHVSEFAKDDGERMILTPRTRVPFAPRTPSHRPRAFSGARCSAPAPSWGVPSRAAHLAARWLVAGAFFLPLALGTQRPTQGKTLALMQVCGGSQSFNAFNQMRVLGRWMRMVTIANQSSIAKAYQEFDENDRIKPSAYLDWLVDVLEELVKFIWLTRDVSPYLVDRYSERKETAEVLMRRFNQASL